MAETYDAIIVGGGPAGSVCAARLASRGRRVAVLERDRHPRFHLGESLLPGSVGVLEELGLLDAMRERFMVKRGARFVDGREPSRAVRYAFADAFHARWDHAFQVPRDAFDELLFRHAAASGAEVREGWEVRRIVHQEGRACGVEAVDADGATHALAARFIIDATGREAMLARAGRHVERLPDLDHTALYTQVRGAWRDAGEREGDIQIVVLQSEDGAPGSRSWLWLIPFSDGRTSVGAVVSRSWLAAHRDARPEALFDAAIAGSPTASAMLVGARRLMPPRATSDFSFRVGTVRGEGWLAIGDAGGFIDPLFSTGVHLALSGALLAADTLHEALVADDLSPARFAAWESTCRAGADLFLAAVRAFYQGELTRYLFADPQHPFLRRAITSLLAGDVFDPEARWARDFRARFAVAAPAPAGEQT